MSGLAIGFMDSSSEMGWFQLEGAGMLAGMLGCEWKMQSGGGERSSETAFVSLRGSLLELRAVTDQLESLRSAAWQRPGFCLRVWSETRQSYLFSRLTQFEWRILPAHVPSVEGGSFKLELKWERDEFFQREEITLPLSNTSGSGVTSGLTLYNHDDAALGHDNWFDVNLQAVGNSWQLPLRLEITNTTSGVPLADFWLGSMTLPESGSLPNLVFEAEDGVGGVVLTNAGCSSGRYCRYDWSGSGWHSLASWTIAALDVSRLQGFGLLPLLRFFTTPAEGGIRLRWELSVDGNPVWLGPAVDLELGQTSLRMEPLFIPWGDLPLRSFAKGHQLILQAFHIGTGEHRLELDDFLLLPQQTFGAYHAVGALKQNAILIDDGSRQAVWSESGGLELTTHLRVGLGHHLQPGSIQRFYCFQQEADRAAPITRTVKVRAWYRPAWRLP